MVQIEVEDFSKRPNMVGELLRWVATDASRVPKMLQRICVAHEPLVSCIGLPAGRLDLRYTSGHRPALAGLVDASHPPLAGARNSAEAQARRLSARGIFTPADSRRLTW